MKPIMKRRIMDFIITLLVMILVMMPVALNSPLWIIPIVLAYGWWNYYDGKPRRNLFDE